MNHRILWHYSYQCPLVEKPSLVVFIDHLAVNMVISAGLIIPPTMAAILRARGPRKLLRLFVPSSLRIVANLEKDVETCIQTQIHRPAMQ